MTGWWLRQVRHARRYMTLLEGVVLRAKALELLSLCFQGVAVKRQPHRILGRRRGAHAHALLGRGRRGAGVEDRVGAAFALAARAAYCQCCLHLS